MWEKFPSSFVLGYVAVSLLATFHAFSDADVASLGNLSKWASLLTLGATSVFDLG